MHRIRTLALALAAVGMAGCHEEHVHHEAKATFPVTTPLRQDASINDEYVARIHAIQHIELRALERGYLTGVFVDEGQLIEKDTKMFQILPRIYDAELRRAKAEQDMANIEFKNTRMLADKNIVAAPQLAMAQAKLAKAKAESSLAQTHRDLSRVIAPFTGLMGRFHVRLGSLVDEGELLTTLSDNSTVWAYFNVAEADYLDLPCRLESADAAFAIESACYARGKDKWDFIDALHGTLKPGGRFAVADCFRRNTKPMPRLIDRAYRRCCDCWVLQEMAEINLFTRSLERAGFVDIRVDDISWHVAPSVAHVPWTALKFIAKVIFRGEFRTLHRERRNNVIAPLLGMVLGMCRPHFSYCIVSGRKPEGEAG